MREGERETERVREGEREKEWEKEREKEGKSERRRERERVKEGGTIRVRGREKYKIIENECLRHSPLISISMSRPVNSHKCLRVLLFSALNTGPISYTLLRSDDMAICLYNWGDWAKQAGVPK